MAEQLRFPSRQEVRDLIGPHRHVLVAGLGRSGIGAVKLLKKLGARVSVSESTPLARLAPAILHWLAQEQVFLEAGGHTVALFQSVDLVVLSPGIPLDIAPVQAALAAGVPVVGEAGLARCYLNQPLLAVTGTNGKSTVVTLLGDMLRCWGKKVFVGGNLGSSLAEFAAAGGEADLVVAEISSFQLDTGPELQPQVAMLLNISPDHLDRYDSYNAYALSKFAIFRGQGPAEAAILNQDDAQIMRVLQAATAGAAQIAPLPGRTFLFRAADTDRLGAGAFLEGKNVVLLGVGTQGKTEEIFDLSATPLNEPPNLENAMATIVAARLIGCPAAPIRQAIASFSPLPHRLAQVEEINGVCYYDDSKATNIGAAASSLRAMRRPVVLIAGGRDKGGDYQLMLELVRQKVKALVLIGEATEKMARAFAGATRIETAASMEEAVHLAASLASRGDAVLLAPACSSFDMFNDYAQRGSSFAAAVRALAPQE